jgi:hypothetical protein
MSKSNRKELIMTVYTFDENIVSDLHKDTYGYRPTSYWWSLWNEMTSEEKQSEWDSLIENFNRAMDEDRRNKEYTLNQLKSRIEHIIALGAGDTMTALKWIMQAEGFDETDYLYGPSYFAYHFDVDYSVVNELPIEDAMKEARESFYA